MECRLRMTWIMAFFFDATATTEIYTLSLHDALPISLRQERREGRVAGVCCAPCRVPAARDRKSTRLNSSHMSISYAVFCLKKKTNTHNRGTLPFILWSLNHRRLTSSFLISPYGT